RARLAEGVVAATPESAAYGRMDLLTVVSHELGHLMGFDHEDAGGLPVMDNQLAAGTRYLLASGGVAAARKDPVEEPAVPAPIARIEWQSPLGEGWGAPLSLYEPVKAKKATGNFADFAPIKPAAGFDSMGRQLLGKDKGNTK
ncbi:MAG TPA: hypothetical protein VFZ81_01495, partial [Burkholderiales bacterium]